MRLTASFSLIAVSLFLFLMLNSCDIEKRIARDYLLHKQTKSVLLMHADYLFKTNKKSDSIPGFKKLSKLKKDSALYFSSNYLQFLNDSVIISSYLLALEDELQMLGYQVYNEDEIDSFLLIKTPAYILNLAQAEVEEYVIPYIDTKVYDDTLKYTREFDLNAVNLNCWFELTKLNSDTAAIVLFSTHSVSDQVEGKFKRHPLFMEVSYRYTMHQISLKDVIGLVSYSGVKDAGYYNDFLLNEEIKREFPPDYKIVNYWHYDRLLNELVPANEWRFTKQK